MSFANTSEFKSPLNLEPDAVETAIINEDAKKVYWCVAYYSESSTNDFTGETTTTYYTCVEV